VVARRWSWEDVVVSEEEANEVLQKQPVGERLVFDLSQRPTTGELKRARTFSSSIFEEDWEAVHKLKGGLGYTFRVFYAINCQVILTKNVTVTLLTSRLTKLGLSRDATSRGLHILEKAGFISVKRESGKAARITLLARPSSGRSDRPSP